jgi:hypothetical protein
MAASILLNGNMGPQQLDWQSGKEEWMGNALH